MLHASRIGDYVFPGRDLSGPMSNMTMLKRILKELSGDATLTVHGLRGTFRTWAQEGKLISDREIVEHCMHHILGTKPSALQARQGAAQTPGGVGGSGGFRDATQGQGAALHYRSG